MTKFAFCTVAVKVVSQKIDIQQSIGFIDAADADEAKGKALRIALKCYPTTQGWANHYVSVRDVNDETVDPEGVFLEPQN